MSSSVADEIAAVERRRCQAMLAGDAEALAAVLDPDCLYIHSTGLRERGEELLARLASGALRYDELQMTVDARRQLAPEVVLVTGRMRATVVAGGGVHQLRLLTTLVWRRGTGGWRLAAFQGTTDPTASD